MKNSIRSVFAVMMCTVLFSACQKNVANEQKNDEAESATTRNVVPGYNDAAGINQQTLVELLKVHAATAKYYKDTLAAVADGYVNLNLRLPNMGFHFGKPELIDGKFDLTQPEFLVYNPDENGVFKLVAVEYGVTMIDKNSQTEPQPTGFTGNADDWDRNTLDLGLFTLHAWVWKSNPDGVFNMMNRLIP